MWKWLTCSLALALVASLGLFSGTAEAKAPSTPVTQTSHTKQTQQKSGVSVNKDVLLPSGEDAFRGFVPPVLAIVINLVLPGIGLGSFIQGDWNGGWTIIGTGVLGWTLLSLGAIAIVADGTVSTVMMLAGVGALVFSGVWSVVAPLQFGHRPGRRFYRRRRRYYRRRYRRPYYKDYKVSKADKPTPQAKQAPALSSPSLAVQF